MAGLFGGEERLEGPDRSGLIHPYAGVRDREQDARSPYLRPQSGGIGHPRDLDLQDAATGHGIARVDGQVHEHLLQLARIRLDDRGPLPSASHQADVLADEPPQHHGHRRHNGVEVHRSLFHDLAARERQNLRGQLRRAGAGPPDLARGLDPLVALQLADQDVRVAVHRREQVVEVVGHAAGKVPHRLESSRFGKPALQQPALGHIDRQDQPRRPPVEVDIVREQFGELGRAVTAQLTPRAAGPVLAPAGDHRRDVGQQRRHVLRGHDLGDMHGQELVAAVAV